MTGFIFINCTSCFVSLRLNFERVNRYCENISRCERRQSFDRRTVLNVWRGFWSYCGDKMERSRVQTVFTKRCHGRGSKESHTSRHRCPARAAEITRAEIQRFVIVGLFMYLHIADTNNIFWETWMINVLHMFLYLFSHISKILKQTFVKFHRFHQGRIY